MTPPSARRVLLTAALAAAPRAGDCAELRLTPAFSLAQVRDDNVFAAPAAEADDITRLGVGLTFARVSGRMALTSRYAIEGERFRRHHELDRAAARQDAAVGLRWTASRRVGVALSADYVDTRTPGELDAAGGFEVGRRRARRLSAEARLTHRLGPLTTARLEPRWSRDRLAGGPGNDLHAATLGLDKRIGPADRASVAYRAQRIAFGGDATLSHTLTVGWDRELTGSTRLAIAAGPCWTGGRLGAEATAGLRRRFRRGEAGIDYLRHETVVMGEPGPVTVEGVRASLSHRLAGPLWLRVDPGRFRLLGRGSAGATLYRVGTGIAWRLGGDVTLSGTHHFGRQEGALSQGAASELTRNTFALALTRRAAGE
jgi:hypothetical protein